MSSGVLQVLIILQVFVMGILAAVASRYAYAHFRPSTRAPEAGRIVPPAAALPPEMKRDLLQQSETQFQTAVRHSAGLLQKELEASASQINDMIKRFATEIVENEMQRYHQELAKLREQTDSQIGGMKAEVAKHQAELKARLEQEVTAEKQRLIKLIDTRLADAVGSFLVDTLQHNVDLGSQGPYLVAMLEEHKAEFVKELADEAKAE